MVEGFDDERNARALRGFAGSYRDETSGADRELVHAALAHLFFTRRDPETKRFDLRLEVPADELAIEVLDEDHARARGRLRLFTGRGRADGQESLEWSVAFDAELERVDGAWRFVRSTHATEEGERPR